MNLESLRKDKLKLSQEEFANLIGVDISKVKEWEKNSNLSIDDVQNISVKTGMDFNTIMCYEKPKVNTFDINNTWEKAAYTKKSIIKYITDSLEEINVTEKQKCEYIDDLQEGIKYNFKKPTISIVGRSDTGKSTLINALIGMEKMPTSWTPTTSIAIYIKHIEDRPEFIKDDVWVFTDNKDGEYLWDVTKLDDKEYCERWMIAHGKLEILNSFGTRQGNMFGKNVGSAVVFIDAAILQNCDIVDLPGFGTEECSDDEITFKATERTDILIYLSQANGFMRIEDINCLKENIRKLKVFEKSSINDLKPLSNLFIVASQAHTVCNGNIRELSNILKEGYYNFCKTLNSEYWDKRKKESGYNSDKYYELAMAQRFYTYTTDIPVLCSEFNKNLRKVLEKLPGIIELRGREFINKYVKEKKPNLEKEINRYNKLLVDREEYVILLKQIESSKLDIEKENNNNKKNIYKLITRLSIESRNEFEQYFLETINIDSLIKMLKDKEVKKKKDEIEYFTSKLQDDISAMAESILNQKSEILKNEIKEYIEDYNENIESMFEGTSIEFNFNVAYVFAEALAKIGIIGGLGAYILGEAAFILGSAFIGGLGFNIALGATIFGPIGILVGGLISSIIGIFNLASGGWRKRVANKIVEIYNEKYVLKKFNEKIYEYWLNTELAFSKAIQKVEEEFENKLKQLKDEVNNYDVKRIEKNKSIMEKLIDFFDQIPL